MPIYKWEGKTAKGVVKKGEMEAPNEAAIRVHLRQQNIIPTKIESKEKGLNINISLPFLKKKVQQRSVAVFTRQLATMIDAGLPLVQSLEVLSSQQDNKVFKNITREIREDVEGGSTFAGALKKHPATFNELYTNLVVAGEEGGILDTILNRLAAYIEALKKKVKSALIYPATIVSVAVIVVIILMVFVIPVFETMFSSAGQSLPLPTVIVLGISKLIKKYIIIFIPVLILLFYLFKRYYKTENGKAVVDSLLLKTPVFGPLFRKIAVARFSRTLGTLVSSGVPILDGLTIVSRTAGNRAIEIAIMNARSSIREGETISEPLGRSNLFPPMVIQMIAVGESTGALDSMLSKIAEFYEDEVDVAVANLTSLLEPLLMMFLGVVIGGVVIAMYLPIFNMASAVG
jgi:type IV pilus assembly protein PilC